MSLWPYYKADTVYPGEWRCVCGCIESGERCWNCSADEDGNKPNEESDE